jgi:predicted methyltransferase
MRDLLPAAVSAVLLSCATTPAGPPADLAALAAAPDRTEADRALDPGRKPAAFLHALRVAPGMRVGELFSGGGYTTELLARAVGPTGVVYGENPGWVLQRFAARPWAERLARPVNANVVRQDRELDAPFDPALSGTLDLVVTNANYHDAVATDVDRARMNEAVRGALKRTGRYVVIDSSARPGTGLTAARTLHRIDEEAVRAEVEAAGFVLLRRDDSLRNPEDTRDWSASPGAAGERRGTSDRFILEFGVR